MNQLRDKILRGIKRYKVSEFQDQILDGLLPAVDLVPGKPVKRKLPAGRSKFGGEPDLHDPDDWPYEPAGRPLHFLAQIRLSDLPAKHIPRSILPAKGWLWFWYDSLGMWEEHYSLRTDWMTHGFQVTFSPMEHKPVRRCSFPSFSERKIPKAITRKGYFRPATEIYRPDPEASLRFKPMYSLNSRALDTLYEAADNCETEELENLITGFIYLFFNTNHQLLGDYDDRFDGDCRESCHLAMKAKSKGESVLHFRQDPEKPVTNRQKKDWRLLLDLGSDNQFNWCWSDFGSLLFWIREQDLAKQDFSKVHGMICSG
ncbi:DUF1963 domain-containing protein [Gimesia algae]|uniref:DUF1963 domain-containing protein n=1 Tax=Gimesia algae TaxID=2527971 RepID=A0A517VDP9_9PLAN|nr:YwqG family protein [Gimesia algae]QDT91128.1 hypothetical protein Pan161_27830 [Gimesia algae]